MNQQKSHRLPRYLRNKPYTLSYHFYDKNSSKNHLDLFIKDSKNKLIHLYMPFSGNNHNKRINKISWQVGSRHRKRYLFFQGKLSKNRGKIFIIERGYLSLKLVEYK